MGKNPASTIDHLPVRMDPVVRPLGGAASDGSVEATLIEAETLGHRREVWRDVRVSCGDHLE